MYKNQLLKSLAGLLELWVRPNRPVEHSKLAYVEHIQCCQVYLRNAVSFHLGLLPDSKQIHDLLTTRSDSAIEYDSVYDCIPYPCTWIDGVMTRIFAESVPEYTKDIKTGFLVVRHSELFGTHRVLLQEVDKETEIPCGDYVGIPFICSDKDWLPLPSIIRFQRTEDGRIYTTLVLSDNVVAPQEAIELFRVETLPFTILTTYFLKLLSCKNIVIRETSAHGRVSRKRPELTYNTLHIKLPAKVYRAHNLPEFIPIHEKEKYGFTGQKRGHFKTYTDQAPLFGKHVGTWYWSPIFDLRNPRDYIVTV